MGKKVVSYETKCQIIGLSKDKTKTNTKIANLLIVSENVSEQLSEISNARVPSKTVKNQGDHKSRQSVRKDGLCCFLTKKESCR
jgi:hypothetical protein